MVVILQQFSNDWSFDVTEGCGTLWLVLGDAFWYIGSGGMGPFGMIKFVLSEIHWDWGDSLGYEDGLLISNLYFVDIICIL